MDNKFGTVMGFLLLLQLLALFNLIGIVNGQPSMPRRPDGFWFGKKPDTAAESVYVEAFFDPVCPDSRDSWPPLKKVMHYYGSRVTLVAHAFPLPYHDNSFVCSRALHIVDKVNTSATYTLLEAFFEHQEQFYGASTVNVSRATVIHDVMKFVGETLGTSFHSIVKSGFMDPETDRATRFSFKNGCLRGVYGTPFFFINGFPLQDAGSPLRYEEWRKIIDPLVGKKDV